MRDEIRVSELALWLRCRRRTYLQYEMGYSNQAAVAGMGSVFHGMLASRELGEAVDEETAAIYDALGPDDQATVNAMFDTYVREVESEGYEVGHETVAVETRLEHSIANVTLTGQFDKLYYDHITRTLVLRDTKTIATFFETAQRDFQLMTYLALIYLDGHFLSYMKDGYNLAFEHEQVKRNKRTARSKPPYIQYTRVYVSIPEIEKWIQSLSWIVAEYKDAMHVAEISELGAEHPAIWAKGTNDCSWYCPFADICGMLDDPEADVQAVLDTEYVKKEEAPQ